MRGDERLRYSDARNIRAEAVEDRGPEVLPRFIERLPRSFKVRLTLENCSGVGYRTSASGLYTADCPRENLRACIGERPSSHEHGERE